MIIWISLGKSKSNRWREATKPDFACTLIWPWYSYLMWLVSTITCLRARYLSTTNKNLPSIVPQSSCGCCCCPLLPPFCWPKLLIGKIKVYEKSWTKDSRHQSEHLILLKPRSALSNPSFHTGHQSPSHSILFIP